MKVKLRFPSGPDVGKNINTLLEMLGKAERQQTHVVHMHLDSNFLSIVIEQGEDPLDPQHSEKSIKINSDVADEALDILEYITNTASASFNGWMWWNCGGQENDTACLQIYYEKSTEKNEGKTIHCNPLNK